MVVAQYSDCFPHFRGVAWCRVELYHLGLIDRCYNADASRVFQTGVFNASFYGVVAYHLHDGIHLDVLLCNGAGGALATHQKCC